MANKENQENKKTSFGEILGSEGVENRILYVMPESIGDIYLSTSLFESIKKQYPNKNLYVATKPEYFDILKGNPYIHKVIPYISQMDQLLWLEGAGDHNGFFEIAFLPHIGTQRVFNYQHNGKDKIAFDLKDE